jgi:phosphoenolpyruvate carboxykinase (GTP)
MDTELPLAAPTGETKPPAGMLEPSLDHMAQFTPRSAALSVFTSTMIASTSTCARRMSSLSMMVFRDIIVFGGRRLSVMPLVTESFNWQHGVFLGATMASETTAAATGAVGNLRRDPFAMLPFCGYNMGDYFAHWLTFAERFSEATLPRLFYVNWFRRDGQGRFVWPGFGENARVLAWMVERLEGSAEAHETPIGLVPHLSGLDLTGLTLDDDDMREALAVHADQWRDEVPLIQAHLDTFADRLPVALHEELDALRARLSSSSGERE